VRLLSEARCTLFPISWPEPFGLVMAESMACGTPVVATRFGAVPEVIGDDRRGGIIVDGPEGLAAGVEAAFTIPPESCRAYAERLFSPRRMVADHLEAYGELLDRTSAATAVAA
jgi:glycosyltransferase involved in cell wall biosynthesis